MVTAQHSYFYIVISVCTILLFALAITTIALIYPKSVTQTDLTHAEEEQVLQTKDTFIKPTDSTPSSSLKQKTISSPSASPNTATPSARKSSSGYYTQGNKIYNAQGQVHIFKGIARPSLEWNPEGEGISLADYQKIKSWNANVVRLALNQKYWLNNEKNYQERITTNIQQINSLGMDVILDLHWSDRGNLNNIAKQERMADKNSQEFWKQVATQYKANTKVFFELYNEPKDISWDVWKNGGASGDGFEVVGMQTLYNTIRQTGADNLIIIGGLNWSFDLSGVPSHSIQGNNIVYASHPYDFQDKNTIADWDRGFGNLSKTHPVMLTEFGSFDCNPTFTSNLLHYTQTKNISWTAWAWYPGGCKFPAIINDWSGTPSEVGQVVKKYLQSP